VLTRHLLPAAAAASILVGSLTTAPASAAGTLGGTFVPTSNCGGLTLVQVVDPPGSSYAVGADGVITAWRFQAPAFPPSLKFKVFRPAGGTSLTVVGATDSVTPAANVLNTFPTRIPVRAGDRLGLTGGTTGECFRTGGGTTGRAATGDPAPGATITYTEESATLDVAAVVEPDADHDGFGDETQDACSSSGSQQTACPDTTAPETTFTSGPTRTKKSKATFAFAASEAGATFECRIKGPGITRIELKTFQPCASPKTYKRLRAGTYRVFARATDAAGNLDPTPAKVKLKVVRKR
jgi:hypothetical protein